MADTPPRDLPAEAAARRDIDAQLVDCGWVVQHIDDLNLIAGKGVAVREVTMEEDHGRADYLLFVDGEAVGAHLAEMAMAVAGSLPLRGFQQPNPVQSRWARS